MGPVDRSRAPLRVVGVGVQAAPAGDGLLLRLIDDEGRSGWGEAAARAGFSGSCASLQRAAGDLAARLTGRALDGLDDVVAVAAELADLASPLRFAAETALLDLEGRRVGASIATLLGASLEVPRVIPPAAALARAAFLKGHVLWDRYKETGDPAGLAAPQRPPSRRGAGSEGSDMGPRRAPAPRSPEGYRALARLRDAGFAAAKIKAPGPWPSALPSLLAVAGAAARAGLVLRVDCNGTMPRRAAPELLGALAAAGIDYVEEPCAGLDPAGWSALAAVGPALAVDESAIESEAFAAHLEAGAAAVVILKPCFVGGLFAARDRALAARARGLRVVVTSALEGPIGAAAAAHLALAIGVEEPCGITLRAGATAPAWLDPARASLRPPDAAGLGVEGPA